MQNNKTNDLYKNKKATQKVQLTESSPESGSRPVTEKEPEEVTEKEPEEVTEKEPEEKCDSNKTVTFDNFINNNSITILKKDHKLIVNLLIVLSKRGAFNIDEYKVIGDLYERLKKLL